MDCLKSIDVILLVPSSKSEVIKFDNPSFPEGSLNAPPLKLKLMLMIGTDLSSTNQN